MGGFPSLYIVRYEVFVLLGAMFMVVSILHFGKDRARPRVDRVSSEVSPAAHLAVRACCLLRHLGFTCRRSVHTPAHAADVVGPYTVPRKVGGSLVLVVSI